MGSQKPGKVRSESVPPRETRPQTKTSSFYACFTTQVIIQRQDISLFLGSSSVFCANASFQTASEQHPLSGGRTERENVEAEAEAAFWLFRLRRSSSLRSLPSVGVSVSAPSRTAVPQLDRGRRCLFSESWNHCGAKSSMRWQRQFLLLPPRTKLSVRPPPPPLRSPLTSPLPKPRPAGSLGFSPLQLYCILHAPNLKGEVQKLVIFEMYIISLNNSRKSNTT